MHADYDFRNFSYENFFLKLSSGSGVDCLMPCSDHPSVGYGVNDTCWARIWYLYGKEALEKLSKSDLRSFFAAVNLYSGIESYSPHHYHANNSIAYLRVM